MWIFNVHHIYTIHCIEISNWNQKRNRFLLLFLLSFSYVVLIYTNSINLILNCIMNCLVITNVPLLYPWKIQKTGGLVRSSVSQKLPGESFWPVNILVTWREFCYFLPTKFLLIRYLVCIWFDIILLKRDIELFKIRQNLSNSVLYNVA